MKYADCNEKQKKAFMNIKYASWDLISGLENAMADNPEDSEEYRNACASLSNHEGLVNELYEMATTGYYTEGGAFFNEGAKSYLKDIRFCGKEWLMERCEARITKEGY